MLFQDGFEPIVVNWNVMGKIVIERVRRKIFPRIDNKSLAPFYNKILRFPGKDFHCPCNLIMNYSSPIFPVIDRKFSSTRHFRKSKSTWYENPVLCDGAKVMQHLLPLWQYRLWSFQGRGTKLERFLAKN